MNKKVLALISKVPETGFVPKCDNVVVFGDRFFGHVCAGRPSHQFF